MNLDSTKFLLRVIVFLVCLQVGCSTKEDYTSNGSLGLTTPPYHLFNKDSLDGGVILVSPIGDLYLETGRILLCDPLTSTLKRVVSKGIEPGSYPAQLYQVIYDDTMVLNIMLKVTIKSEAPYKWIPIECLDSLGITKKSSHLGSDTGLISVMDLNTYEDWNSVVKDDFGRYRFYMNNIHPFMAMRKKNTSFVKDWANVNLHGEESGENKNQNLLIAQSGLGDGYYPIYWGLNASGEKVCLVIDFRVFEPQGNYSENTI